MGSDGPRFAARGAAERASALPLLAAAMVVVTSAMVVMATVGASMVGSARADATADLVALAAVVDGPDTAGRVAAANGATLVSQRRAGGATVVQVGRDGHVSVAAAAPGDRFPNRPPDGP